MHGKDKEEYEALMGVPIDAVTGKPPVGYQNKELLDAAATLAGRVTAMETTVAYITGTTIPAINTTVAGKVSKAGDTITGQITAPPPTGMSSIVRRSDLINGVAAFRRYLRGVNATVTGASTLTGETVAITEAAPGSSIQVDSIKIMATTLPSVQGVLTIFANGTVIYQKTILITDNLLVVNRFVELLNLSATTLPTAKIAVGTGITFTATFTNGGVADIRVGGDQVP